MGFIPRKRHTGLQEPEFTRTDVLAPLNIEIAKKEDPITDDQKSDLISGSRFYLQLIINNEVASVDIEAIKANLLTLTATEEFYLSTQDILQSEDEEDKYN